MRRIKNTLLLLGALLSLAMIKSDVGLHAERYRSLYGQVVQTWWLSQGFLTLEYYAEEPSLALVKYNSQYSMEVISKLDILIPTLDNILVVREGNRILVTLEGHRFSTMFLWELPDDIRIVDGDDSKIFLPIVNNLAQ